MPLAVLPIGISEYRLETILKVDNFDSVTMFFLSGIDHRDKSVVGINFDHLSDFDFGFLLHKSYPPNLRFSGSI